MAQHSGVNWTDSAVNPVMGCDGCELWRPEQGVKHCYAGNLTEMRGGKVKGYPARFEEPETFPGRMAVAAGWSDLRGKDRPDKPWLNGLPRIIFISDMGDALSRAISFVYLRDEVIAHVTSEKGRRHIWMWLTKQPMRMGLFAAWLAAEGIRWPENLWAGTSLTSAEQMARLRQIKRVPAAVRFLSCEPLLGDLGELDLSGIALGIVGGESGKDARSCDVVWIWRFIDQCQRQGVKRFVKQLGARPYNGAQALPLSAPCGLKEVENRIHLRNRAGEDWSEWSGDLHVREWPEVSR